MRVLLFGGAGYIGSVLLGRLLARGDRVTVFDRFYFGEHPLWTAAHKLPPEHRKNLRVLCGDTRSLEALPASSPLCGALAEHDRVVLLAAFPIDFGRRLPEQINRAVNVDGTLATLALCRRLDLQRVLFASSCSVYGELGDNVLDEDTPPQPNNVYAAGKLAIENRLRTEFNDLRWTVARFATVYGLSPKMRCDLVVNRMAASAVRESQIVIHGVGEQWRPLIHVRDVARAVEMLIDAPDADVAGRLYNVGDDEQVVDMHGLADTVERSCRDLAGLPLKRIVDTSARNDPRSHRMTSRRFQELFNFHAGVSIGEGVQEVIRAIRGGLDCDDPRWNPLRWLCSLNERTRDVDLLFGRESIDPLQPLQAVCDVTERFVSDRPA